MRTKQNIVSALAAVATVLVVFACVDEFAGRNNLTEDQVKLIPFTITVENGGNAKATADADGQFVFERDDKLVITGEGISGSLDLVSGIGKSKGQFKGILYNTGSGTEPEPTLKLYARLVNLNDKIGSEPFTGAIAPDLVSAIQQYSELTGESTYAKKSFTLSHVDRQKV